MRNISPRTAAKPPELPDTPTGSSRGPGSAAAPILSSVILALAFGLLVAMALVARPVWSFWRSNEYINSEASAFLPYLGWHLMQVETVLAALGVSFVVLLASWWRPVRRFVPRLAIPFGLVLLLGVGGLGWVAYRLLAPVDRLHSAMQISDRQFFDLFDLSSPVLAPVRRAAAEGNYAAAKGDLIAYYQEKFKTPLALSSESADTTHVLELANDALAHKFTLLATTKQLPGDIDWHEGFEEDREWIFFLNRMLWLPALGRAYRQTHDSRYAAAFVAQMEDWFKDNPLPRWKDENSPSWRLIEAGRRLWDSWIETFQLFADAPEVPLEFKIRMLQSIHDHGQFLAHFRTRFNHLLVESDGLLYAACAFPEFKRAAVWKGVATERLNVEMARQILPDGAHAELAFGYHLLCLTHFYFPVKLASRELLELPPGYVEKLHAMIDFLLFTLKPDGRLPLINDTNEMDVSAFLADLLQTYPRADLRFAASRGAQGEPPDTTSIAFPYAGYYVMRSAWAPESRYLIFDAGDYGGFHGHEDKLSFELSAFGTPMITDAGAYAYTGDEAFRAYFVSTWAHNTVVMDGMGQNRYGYDHYRVSTRADRAEKLRGNAWKSTPDYDYASGVYDDGYSLMNNKGRGSQELSTDLIHRREVVFIKPDYWVLVDRITGNGPHEIEQLFHLTPDAQATIDQNQVWARYANGSTLKMFAVSAAAPAVSMVMGASDPIQGWVATGYNKKVPAPTVVFKDKMDLPAVLCTVLVPSNSDPAADVQCAPIFADSNRTSGGAAGMRGLRLTNPNWTDELMFAGETAARAATSAEHAHAILTVNRTDRDGRTLRHFTVESF